MKFAVNDKVIVNDDRFPGVWTVTKAPTRANEVNYTLTPADGGRGLKIRGQYLLPFNGEEIPATGPIGIPYQPPLVTGTVVTVAGPGWAGTTNPYVVLDQNPNGSAKLVMLGGDDYRYWKKVPRSFLTVIENPTLAVTA